MESSLGERKSCFFQINDFTATLRESPAKEEGQIASE